jgi:hypothetical protein
MAAAWVALTPGYSHIGECAGLTLEQIGQKLFGIGWPARLAAVTARAALAIDTC